ncbi:MAG: hypothetical protein J5782_03595, partial [Clostridia bacterium]|nr:hypothetical protein [Clostridia bacterium]
MSKEFINLCEDKEIRTVTDADYGIVFYCMSDVVSVMRDEISRRAARNYWAVAKHRLLEKPLFKKSLVFEQIKVTAHDGKMRATDFMDLDNAYKAMRSLSLCDNKDLFASYLRTYSAAPRSDDWDLMFDQAEK